MLKNRRKRYFYESVTDGPTDGRTNGRTDQRMDTPSYRVACTWLKIYFVRTCLLSLWGNTPLIMVLNPSHWRIKNHKFHTVAKLWIKINSEFLKSICKKLFKRELWKLDHCSLFLLDPLQVKFWLFFQVLQKSQIMQTGLICIIWHFL